MRQKPIGYTALTLAALGVTDALAIVTGHADPALWDPVLRLITCAGIAVTVLWGISHVVAAMRHIARNQRIASESYIAATKVVAAELHALRTALEDATRQEVHRTSFLRGQIDMLARDTPNGHYPDS